MLRYLPDPVESLHNPRNPRWNLAARVYSMLMAYEYKVCCTTAPAAVSNDDLCMCMSMLRRLNVTHWHTAVCASAQG
jgi:hypothetical protein